MRGFVYFFLCVFPLSVFGSCNPSGGDTFAQNNDTRKLCEKLVEVVAQEAKTTAAIDELKTTIIHERNQVVSRIDELEQRVTAIQLAQLETISTRIALLEETIADADVDNDRLALIALQITDLKNLLQIVRSVIIVPGD